MLESPGLLDFIISMIQLDFSSAHWLPEKSGDCGELATTAELLRHPLGCSSRVGWDGMGWDGGDFQFLPGFSGRQAASPPGFRAGPIH